MIKLCTLCDNPARSTKKNKDGSPRFSKYCRKHERIHYEKNKEYKAHKKDSCEICGFIPINSCQLDVDHIDNNHHNNNLSNLQTLCANCHRLKTFMNGDFISNK